jgi:hypothetical protein
MSEEILKSFDDWWAESRVVRKGEKGIRQDGKTLFAEKQTRGVRLHHNRHGE